MNDIANPEVRSLEAQVSLGVQVEAFLEGPIGKHVIARLESDRTRALEELADANPHVPHQIIEIQTRIRVIDTVQQYLADTLTAAAASLARLEQFDQGD